MDPDANLNEQREIVAAIIALQAQRGPLDTDALEQLAIRLADLVDSLDGWIAGGGFLPARWRR